MTSRRLCITITLFILCTAMAIPTVAPAQETVDMKALYCPKDGEAEGWNLSGETQQFEGDDLFLLIDGGAEIYHEYGFIRVFAAAFVNANGKKMNLEIYEMEDDASAYGIYSFKTAPGGQVIQAGDEALLEDYYLNMWRGRFLVTLIGFDEDAATIQGLKTMAVAVAGKLTRTGQRPAVVSLLPDAGLEPGAVTYLEGPLGFYNRYSIDPEDILGIRQAAFGQYGDAFMMVSQYPDARQRKHWFDKAMECFKKNTRLTHMQNKDGVLYFLDQKGRPTAIKEYQNYIFLSNGFPQALVGPMYHSVEKNIQAATK